jgi:hypothetical protein
MVIQGADEKTRKIRRSISEIRTKDGTFPENRIRIFLGLLDPEPLVRGTDPDPSNIKQK